MPPLNVICATTWVDEEATGVVFWSGMLWVPELDNAVHFANPNDAFGYIPSLRDNYPQYTTINVIQVT